MEHFTEKQSRVIKLIQEGLWKSDIGNAFLCPQDGHRPFVSLIRASPDEEYGPSLDILYLSGDVDITHALLQVKNHCKQLNERAREAYLNAKKDYELRKIIYPLPGYRHTCKAIIGIGDPEFVWISQ